MWPSIIAVSPRGRNRPTALTLLKILPPVIGLPCKTRVPAQPCGSRRSFELVDTPQQKDALSYLVDELGRTDIPPEWRDATVFAAEDLHFPPELRAAAADRLLAIASALRSESEVQDKVVWSALRRGASLLTQVQVERLLPFMQGGRVDTRAVALQAVTRLFESQPPESPIPSVADRTYEFTTKLLDPDVFAAGEPSLIARFAVSALAVLGDPRLQQALDQVKALNRGFLIRRLHQELLRIRNGWLDRGVPCDHPAVKNIDDGLAR